MTSRTTALSIPLRLLAIGALALLAASCGEGRFPVCKSNDECAERSAAAGAGGKVCYNLRCVECRYDTDCPVGKACKSSVNECQDIDARTPDEDNQPKDGGVSAWDPNSWDECAKSCKDSDCIHACDQRFRK